MESRVVGVGVDGCRAGWVAVRIAEDQRWEARVFPTVAALAAEWAAPGTLVLIDVPIGLPDTSSSRKCDAEARSRLLAPRSSSVFNPPTRAAIAEGTWEDATRANEAACGKRISKQTWALVPKIREVDDFLRENRQHIGRFREVHPEVLFQELNLGLPTSTTKKKAEGRAERVRILSHHFPATEQVVSSVLDAHPRAVVQADDVLDALAAAVTAAIYSEDLRTLPEQVPLDGAGIPCEMVYPDLSEHPASQPRPELRAASVSWSSDRGAGVRGQAYYVGLVGNEPAALVIEEFVTLTNEVVQQVVVPKPAMDSLRELLDERVLLDEQDAS